MIEIKTRVIRLCQADGEDGKVVTCRESSCQLKRILGAAKSTRPRRGTTLGEMFAEWSERLSEIDIIPIEGGEMYQVACREQWMREMAGFVPGIGEISLVR